MKLRGFGFFLLCVLLAGLGAPIDSALAASTIDTTKPVQGLPFNPAPIRSNFNSAANDINSLQNSNIGPTQPFTCNLANAGRWWINNTTTVYVYNNCDGPGGQWVPVFQVDTVQNISTPLYGTGIPRTRLAANITLYVATTGSDANSNPCTNPATPCLTVQNAYNQLLLSYDLAGYTATIQLADGTYSNQQVQINTSLVGQSGPSQLVIQGNTGNIDNVVLDGNCNSCGTVLAQYTGMVTVAFLKVQNSGALAGSYGLYANRSGFLQFHDIDFGNVGLGTQVAANQRGEIYATGNYTISGNAGAHVGAIVGSMAAIGGTTASKTITLANTPAFSTGFAYASDESLIFAWNLVFTGTGATGSRFYTSTNSMIDTNTNNLTYFPGNAAGTFSWGGQYDNIVTQRIRLTGNITIYVATTGSDSNNCLSALTPCLTIQNAYNILKNNYDLAGFNATIQLADGTYTGQLAAYGLLTGQTSSSNLLLQGDTGNLDAVVISLPTGSAGTNNANTAIFVTGGAQLTVQYVKLIGYQGIYSLNSSLVAFSNVDFGTAGSVHVVAGSGAQIYPNGSYKISGGATGHFNASFGGVIYANIASTTVTLTGTPAFSSYFATANDLGAIYIGNTNVTFSGSATGARYNVISNSVIDTNGGGATYLPGNSAGSTASGGQYL